MTVLVTYASRHGAAKEVAAAIANRLRNGGLEVTLAEAATVGSVDAYDAVVAGSAVYMGRWLDAARYFLLRNEEAFRRRPTWLFSTGPIGDPLTPADQLSDVDSLVERLGARGHRVFAGKLERKGLSLIERLTVSMVHAPDGDFRDWDAIDDWAAQIAGALQGVGAGNG